MSNCYYLKFISHFNKYLVGPFVTTLLLFFVQFTIFLDKYDIFHFMNYYKKKMENFIYIKS